MTLDPFLRCRRHRSERWKLETGHARIPEYQELQRNKSSLPTFILASSTTPNNPNVATSVVEKKVNLLADEHGECEGQVENKTFVAASASSGLSTSIPCIFLKSSKRRYFQKLFSTEDEFLRRHWAVGAVWPLTGRRETRRQ